MSPLLLLGTGILLLANILHIVGLATTHWTDTKDKFHRTLRIPTNMGLFEMCFDDHCQEMPKTTYDSSLKAVRAFCIIGVLMAFGAIALSALFILIKSLQNNKFIPIGMLLAGVAACGSILLGVIIFGAEIYESQVSDYGYSFALCIVGALGIGAGGVLAFLGARASAS